MLKAGSRSVTTDFRGIATTVKTSLTTRWNASADSKAASGNSKHACAPSEELLKTFCKPGKRI